MDSSAANVPGSGRLTASAGTDYIDLYCQHRVDPTPRSRRPQGPLPAWSPKARFDTSGYPKPAPRPFVGPTLSTRCPPCRRSTRSGPVTPRRILPLLREFGIGFVHTHRWDTAFSRARFAPSTTSPTTTGARRTRGSPERSAGTSQSSMKSVPSGPRSGRPGADRAGVAPHRGDDIAPIPGTRRVARVEQNTAADAVVLTAEQLDRLNKLPPAAGERHDEADMASIDGTSARESRAS